MLGSRVVHPFHRRISRTLSLDGARSPRNGPENAKNSSGLAQAPSATKRDHLSHLTPVLPQDALLNSLTDGNPVRRAPGRSLSLKTNWATRYRTQPTAAANSTVSGAGANRRRGVAVGGGKAGQGVGPDDLDPPLARQPEKAAVSEQRERSADGFDRQPEIVRDILTLHRQIERKRVRARPNAPKACIKNQASRSSAELRPIIII